MTSACQLDHRFPRGSSKSRSTLKEVRFFNWLGLVAERVKGAALTVCEDESDKLSGKETAGRTLLGLGASP
jgi:hypothetical protein